MHDATGGKKIDGCAMVVRSARQGPRRDAAGDGFHRSVVLQAGQAAGVIEQDNRFGRNAVPADPP